jgi:hypothetical protein
VQLQPVAAVGAHEHRRSDIRYFGTRRLRHISHTDEHLGSYDSRLGIAQPKANDLALYDRHAFRRRLHGQIAAGNHDRIAFLYDFIDILNGGFGLDF